MFFSFKILWTIENHHHLVGVCFKSFFNHPGQASLRTWICLRLFVLVKTTLLQHQGTTIQGFVDTGIGQSTCGDYCCGLTKLRSFSSPAGTSGYVCLFESLANLSAAWLGKTTMREGYNTDESKIHVQFGISDIDGYGTYTSENMDSSA